MSTRRIYARVPSVRTIGTARLHEHHLRFHKIGKDGSAKCNIFETKTFTDRVYGLIFDINECEKLVLDRIEGLGFGYEEKSVLVLDANNLSIQAITYYATKIDNCLKPYHWYKEHVWRGAKENQLPTDYVRQIKNVESVADSYLKRREQELSIYH